MLLRSLARSSLVASPTTTVSLVYCTPVPIVSSHHRHHQQQHHARYLSLFHRKTKRSSSSPPSSSSTTSSGTGVSTPPRGRPQRSVEPKDEWDLSEFITEEDRAAPIHYQTSDLTDRDDDNNDQLVDNDNESEEHQHSDTDSDDASYDPVLRAKKLTKAPTRVPLPIAPSFAPSDITSSKPTPKVAAAPAPAPSPSPLTIHVVPPQNSSLFIRRSRQPSSSISTLSLSPAATSSANAAVSARTVDDEKPPTSSRPQQHSLSHITDNPPIIPATRADTLVSSVERVLTPRAATTAMMASGHLNRNQIVAKQEEEKEEYAANQRVWLDPTIDRSDWSAAKKRREKRIAAQRQGIIIVKDSRARTEERNSEGISQTLLQYYQARLKSDRNIRDLQRQTTIQADVGGQDPRELAQHQHAEAVLNLTRNKQWDEKLHRLLDRVDVGGDNADERIISIAWILRWYGRPIVHDYQHGVLAATSATPIQRQLTLSRIDTLQRLVARASPLLSHLSLPLPLSPDAPPTLAAAVLCVTQWDRLLPRITAAVRPSTA